MLAKNVCPVCYGRVPLFRRPSWVFRRGAGLYDFRCDACGTICRREIAWERVVWLWPLAFLAGAVYFWMVAFLTGRVGLEILKGPLSLGLLAILAVADWYSEKIIAAPQEDIGQRVSRGVNMFMCAKRVAMVMVGSGLAILWIGEWEEVPGIVIGAGLGTAISCAIFSSRSRTWDREHEGNEEDVESGKN